MNNLGSILDEYIWGLAEQKEAKILEYCQHCGAELYEGDEAVTDGSVNHFCNLECARLFHGIVEDEYQYKEVHYCANCGKLIDFEYEVYKNNFEELFCCQECADQDAQFMWDTLEGEG